MGLKNGCAVAYTDKGTGTGAHDLEDDTVNLITGERADADAAGADSIFTARLSERQRARFNAATPNRFAFKHADSRLNPEADWGRDGLRSIEFAIYQINAWADVKMRKPDIPPIVEVTARQFEWRIRYPGADGEIGTKDDVHYVNDLHLPVDTDVVVNLKSMDVLHSFFLPNLRIKQDAVPGHVIPMWFRVKETGTFDLVCAELCGWGHATMRAAAVVESQQDFDAWAKKQPKIPDGNVSTGAAGGHGAGVYSDQGTE